MTSLHRQALTLSPYLTYPILPLRDLKEVLSAASFPWPLGTLKSHHAYRREKDLSLSAGFVPFFYYELLSFVGKAFLSLLLKALGMDSDRKQRGYLLA